MEYVAVKTVQGHKEEAPSLYFKCLLLLPVNKMRECAAHNWLRAGGAGSYLSMDDLQDYVTDNMRGILKSEEERNVLDREEKKKYFNNVVKVREPTSHLYKQRQVKFY